MNWTDGATFAVAFATLVLAWFTRSAAQASAHAAQASRQAAMAAEREANATVQLAKEAVEDRQLAWRPHIDIEHPTGRSGPDGNSATLVLRNVGNGPALDCAIWAYWGGHGLWGVVRHLTLQAHGQRHTTVYSGTEPGHAFPVGMFDLPDGANHSTPDVYVAVCRDVLGNRWRFMPGQPPEVVPVNEAQAPPWATWYP